MNPLPVMPYDTSVSKTARVNNQFRVSFDGNKYSVPSQYSGYLLSLKAFTDRICLYHDNNLIAQHIRSYDHNKDIENPDHSKELMQQRKSAREQRLLMDFYKLSPKAENYYQELSKRRMNPRHHIRQITALSEIYGTDKVARAIEDAFTYQAFSCDYIANLLEQRERIMPQPGALHVTRRQDLLELDIAEPNLSIYDTDDLPQEQEKKAGDTDECK